MASLVIYTSGEKESFQLETNENTANVLHAGFKSGIAIVQNTRSSLAPSIRAASRSESGNCSQNCLTRKKL